jgi:hypothetical protein
MTPVRLALVPAIAVLALSVDTAPPDSTSPSDSTTASLTIDDSCLPRATLPDRTAVLGGVTDDGADWVTSFGIDELGIQLVCVDITVDGQDMTPGILGGPFLAANDPGEIVVSVLTTGVRGGPRWHVVRGTVTDAAERVEVSIAGGDPVEAQLADTGPEDGWHWYATAVPAGPLGIPHVTATAYDADGSVIATGESPF